MNPLHQAAQVASDQAKLIEELRAKVQKIGYAEIKLRLDMEGVQEERDELRWLCEEAGRYMKPRTRKLWYRFLSAKADGFEHLNDGGED